MKSNLFRYLFLSFLFSVLLHLQKIWLYKIFPAVVALIFHTVRYSKQMCMIVLVELIYQQVEQNVYNAQTDTHAVVAHLNLVQ